MSKKRPVARDLPEFPPEKEDGPLSWRSSGLRPEDAEPVEPSAEWFAQNAEINRNLFHCPEGMQIVDVEPVEMPSPTFESDLYAHIREWWMMTANEDANLIVRKYEGYGDHSLTGLGRELAELTGREATRGQMQQLAIYYFLLGKMARLKNALLKGEQASDDTWQDITCYAMMGRKIQQHDGWPYDASKGQELPFNGGLRLPD